ncbi:histidine kinase dimerization/phospho-acceptor domain-containing protein [Paenibacillus sp. MBLB4367]|uniref:sensor histidine kinase n=1 Tax=Paenibacillus sp. MBLB4367 TaxID=3384767 RepID=UPI003908032A
MKFRHSLLARYLLIILSALLLWPFVFPVATILYYSPELAAALGKQDREENSYGSASDVEKLWHREAEGLKDAPSAAIDEKLRALKERYPEASLFWVDGSGRTRLALPEQPELPAQWTAADSIAFMKKGYGGDPFTVVAFIGQDPRQGFMAVRLPRELFKGQRAEFNSMYFVSIVGAMFVLFIFVSWLFFYRIRKRLVRLQEAMTSTDDTGIPLPLAVSKKDEIGQLEGAFNRMVSELLSSRTREAEEEKLRKQLIANLSHDLRTPLTMIRGHAYSLGQEPISDKGKASVALIADKTDYLGQLIENLLSYTLLSAGKYPLDRKQTDVFRLIRASAAGWYPVFEKEGFEVDVDLPEEGELLWSVDPAWFTRILDNLFQNVVRHARTGRYIGIRTEAKEGRTAIVIADKGPGMHAVSEGKGAGIGLTIVSMMVKDMQLQWEIVNAPEGVAITLYPKN